MMEVFHIRYIKLIWAGSLVLLVVTSLLLGLSLRFEETTIDPAFEKPLNILLLISELFLLIIGHIVINKVRLLGVACLSAAYGILVLAFIIPWCN